MNTQEFSSEFDILYNNIKSNAAPSINEYEKSVFLTDAQTELLKNYFTPKGNKYGEGIDDSIKRQLDFSSLTQLADTTGDAGEIIVPFTKVSLDRRAKSYLIPSNVLIVLNETAIVNIGATHKDVNVIPLSYDEYTRLMSKPYKEPLKGQIWKLVSEGNTNDSHYAELIPASGSTITYYGIRYIRKPRPIILDDLSDATYGDISIDGYTQPVVVGQQACELNPLMHRDILKRAVELAKVAYLGDLKTTVELNNRNE